LKHVEHSFIVFKPNISNWQPITNSRRFPEKKSAIFI
jgi:hypothetical protein